MILSLLLWLLWFSVKATFAIFTSSILLLLVLYIFDRLTYTPLRSRLLDPAGPPKSLGNRKFTASDLPREIDTIIIGAGQGGLSCGAVLSQHYGETVVVFEQHEVIGGGAHTFAVDGKSKWHFDAGLHITIPPHEQILQVACGCTTSPVPFARLRDPTTGASDYISFSHEAPLPVVPGPLVGPLRVEEALVQRFPRHKAALAAYFALTESLGKRFGIFVATSLLPARLRGILLGSPLMKLWRQWSAMTGEEGLRKCFPGDDEETCRLRSYLVGLWLDTGSPPSRHSFFMQSAVMGQWQKLGEGYPIGGPHRTVLALADAIEGRGLKGRVYVRCPITRIVVENGTAVGVQLSDVCDGLVVRAKRVVSGIGHTATERLLFGPATQSSLQTQMGCGFVMANIAMEGTAAQLGITDASLWLQPATKENYFDALVGIEDFFRDPLGVPIEMIPAGITFPSVKARDTDRYHTCQILVPVNMSFFAPHGAINADGITSTGSKHAPPHLSRHDQDTYDEMKFAWEKRLVELLQRHFPKITKDCIAFVDVSTPQTIAHYLRVDGGSAIGLDVTPPRFIDTKEMAALDSKHPKIKNMWRCGQDYLLCGQVLAAVSGIVTAIRIQGLSTLPRFAVRVLRLLTS